MDPMERCDTRSSQQQFCSPNSSSNILVSSFVNSESSSSSPFCSSILSPNRQQNSPQQQQFQQQHSHPQHHHNSHHHHHYQQQLHGTTSRRTRGNIENRKRSPFIPQSPVASPSGESSGGGGGSSSSSTTGNMRSGTGMYQRVDHRLSGVTSGGTTTRLARNVAEKQRRDKLNSFINDLANSVPLIASASRRLDKTSILRLSAAYLRLIESPLNPSRSLPSVDEVTMIDSSNGSSDECSLSSHQVNPVMEYVMDGFMIIFNGDFKLIYVGSSCERFLGHQNIDMMGFNVTNFLHPSDVEPVKHLLSEMKHKFLTSGRMESERIQFRCRMRERSQPRTEVVTYQIVRVVGFFQLCLNQQQQKDHQHQQQEDEEEKCGCSIDHMTLHDLNNPNALTADSTDPSVHRISDDTNADCDGDSVRLRDSSTTTFIQPGRDGIIFENVSTKREKGSPVNEEEGGSSFVTNRAPAFLDSGLHSNFCVDFESSNHSSACDSPMDLPFVRDLDFNASLPFNLVSHTIQSSATITSGGAGGGTSSIPNRGSAHQAPSQAVKGNNQCFNSSQEVEVQQQRQNLTSMESHESDGVTHQQQQQHRKKCTLASEDVASWRRTCSTMNQSDDRVKRKQQQQVQPLDAKQLSKCLLFKGFVEIVSASPMSELSLMDANQEEYVSRISLDGTLLYTDHRISLVLGYTPAEVIGKSAYKYILVPDHVISLFAHKLMLSSSNGTGLVVHRLRTRSGGFVYLQSAGCLQYDRTTGKVDHFVCVGRLLPEAEGREEMQKFIKKFAPHTAYDSPQSLYQSLKMAIEPKQSSLSSLSTSPESPSVSSSSIDQSASSSSDPEITFDANRPTPLLPLFPHQSLIQQQQQQETQQYSIQEQEMMDEYLDNQDQMFAGQSF